MEKNLVIGLDYGTDSVRSVIVDTAAGQEIASDVFFIACGMLKDTNAVK